MSNILLWVGFTILFRITNGAGLPDEDRLTVWIWILVGAGGAISDLARYIRFYVSNAKKG